MAFIFFAFYFTLDKVQLLLLIFLFFLFVSRVCHVVTAVGITFIFGDQILLGVIAIKKLSKRLRDTMRDIKRIRNFFIFSSASNKIKVIILYYWTCFQICC